MFQFTSQKYRWTGKL